MTRIRPIAAALLAIPLGIFGLNDFLHFFALPEPEAASEGLDLLMAMRKGGLMTPVAASHVVIALGLLLARTRWLSALLQLPMSLGILAFHATMMPEGLGMAAVLLGLNLLVLADPKLGRCLA